jgi:hypothetical protein
MRVSTTRALDSAAMDVNDLDRIEPKRHYRWVGRAALFAASLVVAGCGSDIFGKSAASSGSSPSFGDRLSNLFSSKSSQAPAQPEGPVVSSALPEDFDCPTVSIRQGASTFSVSAGGAESTAMSMRYQATISDTARECKLAGPNLTIRVGVEGRVILGPAGGAGQFEIPVRYAVVREGPEPKTVAAKLRWVKVEIPAGEGNVPFTVIEDDLSFPTPKPQELDAYVVYVGFDSTASKMPEKKAPVKKPAAKPKRST